jgi:cell division ATPase FtsA
MPVRIGTPNSRLPITGLSRTLQSPAYSTSIGLLLWGLLHEDQRKIRQNYPAPRPQGDWMGRVTKLLKNLLPG